MSDVDTDGDGAGWYLYVVECDDGTLYTGVTTDPERRVHEHNNTTDGASYTRGRRPVELVAVWAYPDRSSVSRAEHEFKSLTRPEKVEAIETVDASY